MEWNLSASIPCRLPGSDTPEYLENIPGYVFEVSFASCENVQVQAPAGMHDTLWAPMSAHHA